LHLNRCIYIFKQAFYERCSDELMKKLFVFISVFALISFAAACAFAAAPGGHVGHVDPKADVRTDPAINDYSPTVISGDVSGVGSVDVILVKPNDDTPGGFDDPSNIYLPKAPDEGIINRVSVMTNVTIDVDDGDGLPSPSITFSFADYPDGDGTGLYAFIKANSDADDYGYTPGMFYSFPCTVTPEPAPGTKYVVSFAVDDYRAFFTANTVVFAKVESVPSGGGGGGGCNAGYAGLLLLAAVPFFFRKKR
jgi:Synergist-CTERM protein sorting domain-containing protein